MLQIALSVLRPAQTSADGLPRSVNQYSLSWELASGPPFLLLDAPLRWFFDRFGLRVVDLRGFRVRKYWFLSSGRGAARLFALNAGQPKQPKNRMGTRSRK